jgi:ABC-type transport system involved in multi-copper enzyme maturation permease subunit
LFRELTTDQSPHEADLDRRALRPALSCRGYVLLVVFLAINGFPSSARLTSQTASLRPMLDLLPWEFLFFVPAVTMRTLAEDLRSGQIEVVLAQPLSELELLLGKYLGSVLFLWVALALTLPIPLGPAAGPTPAPSPPSMRAALLAPACWHRE